MIVQTLFREHDYPGNVISGTAGSAVITGTGTVFSDYPVNTGLFLDDNTFLGVIASIASDTSLTLDRVLEETISGQVYWCDWSLFRTGTGSISRQVESEYEGECGVIVFDDVDMSFYLGSLRMAEYHGQTNVVLANPIEQAFASGIDNRKRFLIKVNAMKRDLMEPRRIVTDSYDYLVTDTGAYLQAVMMGNVAKTRFIGVVDFTSIKTEMFNDGTGEFAFEKSFRVVDKLSALNTLARKATRVEGFVNPDVVSGDYDQMRVWKYANTDYIGYFYAHDTGSGTYSARLTDINNCLQIGDLIRVNFLDGMGGSETWQGIALSAASVNAFGGINGNAWNDMMSNYTSFNATGTTYSGIGARPTIAVTTSTHPWIASGYCGTDIFVRKYLARAYQYVNGATANVTIDVATAIDGIKLIQAILAYTWSDAVLVNRLKDGSGAAVTEVPLPLEYLWQLYDEFPLGKDPLDALKEIVNMMQCYVYVDTQGRFVVENISGWGVSGEYADRVQTIDLSTLGKFERSEFSDKLVDSVEVTVNSYLPALTDGYMTALGYAFKVQGIKPRNELKKELVVDELSIDRLGFTKNSDGTLSYPGLSTQDEILTKYANLVAEEYLNFYGKRHAKYEGEEVCLTWERMDWDMLHGVDYEGGIYFITNLQENLDEDSGSFTMIEVAGHDYNLETVVIGKARDEYLSGN